MKHTRLFFTVMMAISVLFNLLAAPLSNTHEVSAQTGDEIIPGWDIEIILPADTLASIQRGEMNLLGDLLADGLQASLEGDVLKISGSGGTDELRRVLYESIGHGFSLISYRTDLSVSLPIEADQPLTLKLETSIATGYDWDLAASDGVQLQPEGAAQYQNRNDGMSGGPQLLTLQYKATAAGIGKLNLSYERPFGEPEPARVRVNLRLAEYAAEIDLSNPNPPVEAQLSAEPEPANEPIPSGSEPALPASFDWRTQGIVPPIRDQGNCNSGWAFASVGTMETAIAKSGGPLTDLSEQFLISCNKDSFGCNGGSITYKYHLNDLANLQTIIGAVLESTMPYTATKGTCTKSIFHPYKAYGWNYLSLSYGAVTVENIKTAIYNNGPVAAYVCIGPAFRDYTGGIFDTDETSQPCAAVQYVMLVGWDDATQTWILRNSYGTAWGEAGYMNIKWGTSRVNDYASWMVYTTPLIAPVTVLPSDTTLITTPTFTWTAGTYATSYNLQVYSGNTLIINKYYPISVCKGTSCSYPQLTPLPYGSYTWKVRAFLNTGKWGDFTADRNFEIARPLPLSPNGTITDTTPAFQWSSIPWTSIYSLSYDITIYRGSTIVAGVHASKTDCQEGVCTKALTTPLTEGTYTWKVRASTNTGIYGDYSPLMEFIVASAKPVTPTGRIYNANPTYQWTVFTGASQYQLQVYHDTSLVVDGTYEPSNCTQNVCSATPANILPTGDYTWKVRAYLNGSWMDYSNPMSFNVAAAPPALQSPNTIIYVRNPTYKWNVSNGATGYHLLVYRGSTIVTDQTYTTSVCSSGICSVTPTTVLPDFGYTWKVQTLYTNGWSDFSPLMNFSVGLGFNSSFSSNSTSVGWAPVYGKWGLSKNYPGNYVTSSDAGSVIYQDGSYTTLDYQVRMKQNSCRGECYSYIVIRGNTGTGENSDRWDFQYSFGYSNKTRYTIHREPGYGLPPSGDFSRINSSWNILRVVAVDCRFWFYINGYLVINFVDRDNCLREGKVGITMNHYDNDTGNQLLVDWAKLTTKVSPTYLTGANQRDMGK